MSDWPTKPVKKLEELKDDIKKAMDEKELPKQAQSEINALLAKLASLMK